MGDMYREQTLMAIFHALDVDSNGAIQGGELIDRIELLDLGPLRTAGAQLSAVLRDGMTLDQFLEVSCCPDTVAPPSTAQRGRESVSVPHQLHCVGQHPPHAFSHTLTLSRQHHADISLSLSSLLFTIGFRQEAPERTRRICSVVQGLHASC